MIVNINRFRLQLQLHLTATMWIRSCFEWFTLHHEFPGCQHSMLYYINSLKQTAQKHVENLIIFSVKSECIWFGVESKENSQLMQFGLFVRSGVPLFSLKMFELLFRISIDIQLFLFVLCMLSIFKILDYKWALCMLTISRYVCMFVTQISVCHYHCGQFRGQSMLFNRWLIHQKTVHSVLDNKCCYNETGSTI